MVTACHDSNTAEEPNNRHPVNDNPGYPSQAEHLACIGYFRGVLSWIL